MKEKSKRLQIGGLSSMVMMMVGPDLKNPSHLTCSCLINLVIYDKQFTYGAIIDRMMWLYAQMHFPTERFETS